MLQINPEIIMFHFIVFINIFFYRFNDVIPNIKKRYYYCRILGKDIISMNFFFFCLNLTSSFSMTMEKMN